MNYDTTVLVGIKGSIFFICTTRSWFPFGGLSHVYEDLYLQVTKGGFLHFCTVSRAYELGPMGYILRWSVLVSHFFSKDSWRSRKDIVLLGAIPSRSLDALVHNACFTHW